MQFAQKSQSFLGCDEAEFVAPRDAKVVVIPFGLEESVSYEGGTKKAPQAIIAASKQLELFDEEFWKEPYRDFGVATLKSFPIAKPQTKALKQLEKIVEEVLQLGKFPLILGGEHSLTAGATRPFAKKFKQISILHFDAHADLYESYLGNRYSHASALRRCLDFENVNVVSLGIRSIPREVIPYAEKEKRLRIFWAKDKAQWKIKEIIKALGDNPVYLSFDVDAFDSSMMPATGTPEPGGLFWDEALAIIRKISEKRKIVGGDIVELAPIRNLHACDFLTAKLAYKILSYALTRK